MLLVWLKGFLFSLSLCFDLSMVNVAILKTGLERGFRSSFLLGLGSCLGDLTYLTMALLGLAVIFDIPAVSWTLWMAGTPILLWFAYRMVKESLHPRLLSGRIPSALDAKQDLKKDWKLFAAGAGLALSSPSVIVWFAAMSGPIVAGFPVMEAKVLAVFISGFFAAGVVWSLAMALLSSRTGKMLGTKAVRWLSLASAAIFLYFAWHVFRHGLETLL